MPTPTRTSAGDLERPPLEWLDVTMPTAGTDVTGLLQRLKRSLRPGQGLRLPEGTWRLSDLLHTDEPDTGFRGAVEPGTGRVGTRLEWTTPDRASYQVHGKGVGVLDRGAHRHWLEGLDLVVLGWQSRGPDQRTGQNEAGHSPLCLRNGVEGTRVQDVLTQGARGAGLFNYQTTGTWLNRVKARDCLADGIHSNKWRDFTATDCATENTGDDCIAGVTYAWDPSPQASGYGFQVWRFTGRGNTHGRGVACINSRRFDVYDVDVSDTGGAGVIVARETRKDTELADTLEDVSMERVTITRANHALGDDHGAVALINGNAGTYRRVSLRDFDLVDTGVNRYRTAASGKREQVLPQVVRAIGYGKPRGAMQDVTLDRFRLWGTSGRDSFGGNLTEGIRRTGWERHDGIPRPPRTPRTYRPEVWRVRSLDARGEASASWDLPLRMERSTPS